MSDNEDTGKRHKIQYRNENLYVMIGEKSLTMSMRNMDHHKTTTGLDIISNLVTLLLEKGVDKQEISGRIFEASIDENDLAWNLDKIIGES